MDDIENELELSAASHISTVGQLAETCGKGSIVGGVVDEENRLAMCK